MPGDSKTLDVPDCLSRLITGSSPLDENELHRLKTALQTDDVNVKAGSEDTLDNKARTELEASVEEKTAEVAAWKQPESSDDGFLCGFGGRMDAMSCTFALRIDP